jgi:hypothetical protein
LALSWDKVLEAHGYRVYASGHVDSGYMDITGQGVLITGERITWTAPVPEENWKFYLIKSYRQ